MTGEVVEASFFVWISSLFTVLFSLVVLLSANPVASAVALMGTLFSSAALYFALGNYFMGSVQILVYAGAVAVLFVFIVMLLDLRPHALRFFPGRKTYIAFAGFVGLLFASAFFKLSGKGTFFVESATDSSAFRPSAIDIAEYFISRYQVAFQMAGLLIFGAILGALVFARSHLKAERTPNE